MRAHLSFSLTVLASLLAAGCAVGPDYRAPALATSDRFVGQAAVDQRQTARNAELANWWQGFNDPMLTALVTAALNQNLDLAQASARLSQSKAFLRTADAALLPNFAATGQAAKAHLSVETPLGRVLNSTPDFNRNGSDYEFDLGGSWELDLFGGNRRAQEAARAEYQASQAGVVATQIAVAAQVADTYITIRGLQARRAIALQQVETRSRLLSTVRLQFDKGIAAELQVRQAEGSLALVQASIPTLDTSVDVAMNALDVLLGVRPGSHRAELETVAPIPEAPGISASGNPADLLRRRPDLIVAERRLAASNARIGVAVAGYYPKLSLGALVGTASTVGSNLFDGTANQTQAVLGLRWRLFDFGRVDAEINAAKGQNAEALAAYREAALKASEDVEDAFSALVKREQQARILASGEDSLSHARQSSFAAYKGGVVSLIEVLDADANLLAVRDAKAQAQTETARAAVASFKALGGGWKSSDAPHS